MTDQKRSLRVGIAAMLCALVFRFFTPQTVSRFLDFLTKPETVAFLIYAETGHKAVFSEEGQVLPETIVDADLPFLPESPGPELPQWVIPAFGEDSPVQMYYGCSYRPELTPLLQQPLTWDLRADHPTVLIYHTHTTESYEKGSLDYEETAPYRTLNADYNITAVGDRVTELLEAQGIHVIHDREVHDYPDFNSAYLHSRLAVKQILKEQPGLLLLLDLHRDAMEDPEGRQIKTAANAGGSTSAQLMIVVGTNSRLPHRGWPQNLSLGLKLHAQLETETPGIARPLCLRPQRFNQDLSPGALLIEIGSAGNSLREALLAGEQLAKAIIAISRGTATADGEWTDSDPLSVPAADF